MKKKLINIVKKDDVPVSLELKVIQVICVFLVVITIMALILGAVNTDLAIFIWKYFLIPGKGVLFYLSQFFTFKIVGFRGGLFYLLVLFIIILIIGDIIIVNNESITKKKRNAICNGLRLVVYPLLR